ncbi:MAG: 30S ribosomal protein S3 [Caldilineae bacterium]|nr:30S ribosomal protein S3 [Anaerolineae bacterium]MCB0198868.1 30S ribosomal protein S3 [Anaerolineae bacterium]MCB0203331.1 30S ribosomal protein S3 [Anaerolineae bacterium]MCB0252862.1 30S ribosomal protein S3 [Anaerolineae bacterium]MCB9153535.1 30S ribosomal protein S3 [Caldilineae bacterium]
MGRKVHPYGFRLGFIKDWQSRWYAERDRYTTLLEEDRKIRTLIRRDIPRASISAIEIERQRNYVHVWIHTAKPGIIIGRKGANVNQLRSTLQEVTGKRVKVDVTEITRPEIDAYLVAESIAEQLERRISHKRAMRQAVTRAMRQGAEGIMITCAGRLSGSEMARRDSQREGQVPRHTLRADIDYATAEALTTFGRIGVKVWIYKGEILPPKTAVAS